MPLRQLLIGIAVISVAAGVAAWGIRTYQQPAHASSVVMTGVRYAPDNIGAHNNRNRQVVLINNLDISELESTVKYRISSVRAINTGAGTLLTLVVTAPTSSEAIAGANAVAAELLLRPLGDEQITEPLEVVLPASDSQPTSVPIQDAAATAVVVGILGLAAIVVTRPDGS